ncbi:MAG: hypothetical protein JNL08_04245, partial [Planctomycetes bacterium]|nr:hypothetical protein [Planctomycetota bacterium]
RAKGSLFDGGGNVPLLVRGPAVTAPGTVATELVAAVDLFPTLLAMCGAGSYPPPSLAATALPIDGQSVLPALAGQPGYGRPFVYCEITGTPIGGGYTLRTPTHRLIRYTMALPEHQEFYNLVADPNATTNLLQSPLSPTAATAFNASMAQLEAIRSDGWAEVFGTGCGGSAGVPFLRTQERARIGHTHHTAVESVPTVNTGVLTLVGMSRTVSGAAALPLDLSPFGMPGCRALVSHDIVLLHGFDHVSPPLPIPNLPSLYGTEFYVQAVVGELGANPLGLIWSRGLRCIIGM